MPAPLAKGIILLSSILVAAGLAAYENPEVRAWIDERRRRIALVYNEIVDEFERPRPQRRRTWREDASMREDPSAEAAERKRKARQEIAEKGILLGQKRRAAFERQSSASTFDELVDAEGKLLEKCDNTVSTALEEPACNELRHRSVNMNAFIHGSTVANPFDDETSGAISETGSIEAQREVPTETTVSLDTQPQLWIDTSTAQTASIQSNSEEAQLTPTTSVATSTLLSDTGILTPTSAHDVLLLGDQQQSRQSQLLPLHAYSSTQEWVNETLSDHESFYSSPEIDQNDRILRTNSIDNSSQIGSRAASHIGTNDGASDLGVEALSDSGADTPDTWSVLGSHDGSQDDTV